MMNKKFQELTRRNPANTTWVKKNLYVFDFQETMLSTVSYKIFDSADIEGLDFVLKCRSSNWMPHFFDSVIGPTADDDTSFCINNYCEGVYGLTSTNEAKHTLLRNLDVENLGIQVFIETSKGLSLISGMKLI